MEKTKNNGIIKPKTLNLWEGLIKAVAPPPNLTISEWADKYRILSRESSAEPGQWHTDRAPYQREIMDAISDKATEIVVIMTSAQVRKTEIELNTLGYYIDYDPAPILIIHPTESTAKKFSIDKLEPMIRDTPSVNKKVMASKSRTSGNTMLHKKFTGGHVSIIGANAPGELASKSIRVVLADEIDRFPASAGKEGDPLKLGIKRTNTFWNRKIVEVSTPTIKGSSRIAKEYEESSQEVWNVPCPACGEYQPYKWKQIIFNHNEDDNESIEVLGHVCKHCGTISNEQEWKKGQGKWVAKFPKRKRKRGFHLNEMASPWKHWDEIVRDFLEARKKIETLKVWVNTSLGEPWEEKEVSNLEDKLYKRRERYNCEVPLDVVFLTCGVDVQDDRLEYEIVGWGREEESWGIKYGVIMGDPGQNFVWNELDIVLDKKYIREDGLELNIMSTCVDSGGHFTKEVYKYCKKREFRRVWAIKGQGGNGNPYIKRPKKRNDAGVYLFNVGVDIGKDTIMSRLNTEEAGPCYCHFPEGEDRNYNDDYFKGLLAERRVEGKWEKRSSGARNEPFDLRNYATAALEIYNPQLNELYKRLNEDKETEAPSQSNKVIQRRKSRVISKGVS